MISLMIHPLDVPSFSFYSVSELAYPEPGEKVGNPQEYVRCKQPVFCKVIGFKEGGKVNMRCFISKVLPFQLLFGVFVVIVGQSLLEAL